MGIHESGQIFLCGRLLMDIDVCLGANAALQQRPCRLQAQMPTNVFGREVRVDARTQLLVRQHRGREGSWGMLGNAAQAEAALPNAELSLLPTSVFGLRPDDGVQGATGLVCEIVEGLCVQLWWNCAGRVCQLAENHTLTDQMQGSLGLAELPHVAEQGRCLRCPALCVARAESVITERRP